MAREGGFFSGSERKDKRIAGNLGPSTPIKNYGGNMGFSQDFGAGRVTNVKPKKGFSLKDVYGTPRAQFFSPSGNEIGQIASATTDLSGLMASKLPSDYKETESQVNFENMLRKNFGDDADTMDYGIKQFIKQDFQRPDGTFDSPVRFQDNLINKALTDTKIAAADFDKEGYDNFLKKDFGIDSESGVYKSFPNNIKFDLRQQFKEKNNLKFKDSSFAPTDTKIAMDNLGGYGAIGGVLGLAGLGLKGIQSAIEGGKRLRENLDKKLNPESIQDKVGGFFNRMTGISPVAAGTLDANQQVTSVSERPKLNYVNPDAKTMSISEIKDAFKPKNLFGYQDKFGRFDDPGSPLARDRAETIQRVAQNFSSPITADARTIGQIRADQEARMRENARLRNESFKRGERVQQKSADVTYNTGMLSNPAYGFREKMTDAAKAKYDQSAKDATEMARTDPSLGNVVTQTFNRVSGFFGGPQASLEKIGERQLRLANKEINRPRYQKEAYARKFLGITNDQLKAKNLQQIRANAYARNQAFQNEKIQRALEKSAKRRGENVGTGRDGGFGTGTSGQGMPSNPKGFSGYSRKSSPSTGTGTGTSPSKTRSRGGISKSTSRGQGGGTSSRSKGGVSRGGSKAKSSGSRGQGGGTASRSKGGSFGGSRRSTNRSKSRRRCDIRTKIDITSLTNQNLMKDDLATVAYFVQELRGE
tara:strand:- start:3207 stop:5312 length:2106 start_codon:yes stop_codon:yes gene_type:complete